MRQRSFRKRFSTFTGAKGFFEPGSEAFLKSFPRTLLQASPEKGFSQSSNAAKLHHGPTDLVYFDHLA
jgi:hypothetical protein